MCFVEIFFSFFYTKNIPHFVIELCIETIAYVHLGLLFNSFFKFPYYPFINLYKIFTCSFWVIIYIYI